MKKVPCDPKVGADVELFLADKDGNIVPCVGKISGTKDNPYQHPDYPEGYMLQEDNVMLEFNIPASEWPNSRKVLSVGKHMVLEVAESLNLIPVWNSFEHRFSKAQLNSQQAQRFGCDPDFDAYNGGKMRPQPPNFGNTRFCGGHIHIGGNFKCPDFVAALFLEFHLAVNAGMKYFGKSERAQWYGKPGIFRPKPYGIEYRTPTNAWINQPTADRVLLAAQSCASLLTHTSALELQKKFKSISWTKLRGYVETGDRKLRAELAEEGSRLRIV